MDACPKNDSSSFRQARSKRGPCSGVVKQRYIFIWQDNNGINQAAGSLDAGEIFSDIRVIMKRGDQMGSFTSKSSFNSF
jgi:hypothetical protein